MLGDRPITLRSPIQNQDLLPQKVDVAIIGGGVIGIFTALYLARKGKKVVVLEKGRTAGEQSSRNWGWIRQQGRDEAELPIVTKARQLWAEVDAELKGATGFRQGGVTYLASTEKKMKNLFSWEEVANKYNLETRFLTDDEIDGLINKEVSGRTQDAGQKWIAALHTPSDARAEPWKAVPAVAELAKREGAIIRENCAVRALETSAGNLTGVVTEDGVVQCEQAVVCAGAWSSLFLRRHGFSIPQLMVRENVCQTEPLPQFIEGAASDEKLAFRRREDGGYTLALNDFNEHMIGPDTLRNLPKFAAMYFENFLSLSLKLSAPRGFPDNWLTSRNWAEDEISPFEKMRVLDPAVNQNAISRMQTLFAERFPALGRPRIKNSWAGMIDTMPDIVPIVDRIPDLSGVIVATGMSGHGFGIGPGFAEIIAKMACEEDHGHDLSRFRYMRFFDGSSIAPGPHI